MTTQTKDPYVAFLESELKKKSSIPKKKKVKAKKKRKNRKKVVSKSKQKKTNFSKSFVNPGAINDTNSGIKISIIKTIMSKDKKRILKILFANNFALLLLLFNSDE